MVTTRSQTRAVAPPPAESGSEAESIWRSGEIRASQPVENPTAELSRENDEVDEVPKRKTKAPSSNKATAGARTRTKTAKAKGTRQASPVRPFTPGSKQGQPKTILDLPAELRNDIWTMLVVRDKVIDIAPERPFVKEPALLAVSHQIRSEAMSLWYAEHEFRIMGSNPAVKFLRSRTDQQLRSIRKLYISSEKSDKMKKEPRAWLVYLQSKTQTLMREFEERGLRESALKFQVWHEEALGWIRGDQVHDAWVSGDPDQGTKIRSGPRQGQKVVGRGSC